METLFIQKIINKELFNKTPSIILDGLFCSKELLYTTNDDNKDEYEFIINIDNTNLTDEEDKEKNTFISILNEEQNRITTNMKFLIDNLDLTKISIQDYKVIDYSDMPNYLKKKMKTHNYDAKKFIIKNNIDKNKLICMIAQLTNNDEIKTVQTNELKLIGYFIVSKIIDLFNLYLKSILYTLELLKEHPYLFRYKNEYLISINPAFFTITNNEISILHFNTINNAFTKAPQKNNNIHSSTIHISKNTIKFT
jgi:hypothetical protein